MNAFTRVPVAIAAVVFLASAAASIFAQSDPSKPGDDAADREAAAARYVANLKAVVATQVLPGLQRAILATATSRPSAVFVEVTDDPSPYSVGARLGSDQSWIVRFSLGYTTMHDAALDAAGLAAALDRPRELRRYLAYQQRLARENLARRARGQATNRAVSFAEFIGLDPKAAAVVFAQREWKQQRDRVQIESLGWVVAYLLTRADPRLAGLSSSSMTQDGEGAARLTAAAGWLPVPPFPTALELSAIERSAAAPPDERAQLCRAARLMETGMAVTRTSARWRARVEQEPDRRTQLAGIEAQIRKLRRDGGCASTIVVATSSPRGIAVVENSDHLPHSEDAYCGFRSLVQPESEAHDGSYWCGAFSEHTCVAS